MEQWQQSRCSDTAIYYHIYVLIYHLQDKYCYYSLHVSAHLAYGSLLGRLEMVAGYFSQIDETN